jgi:hypothetical protein
VNIIADMFNGFPGMAHTGAARAGNSCNYTFKLTTARVSSRSRESDENVSSGVVSDVLSIVLIRVPCAGEPWSCRAANGVRVNAVAPGVIYSDTVVGVFMEPY